jgi:hypothetical protein
MPSRTVRGLLVCAIALVGTLRAGLSGSAARTPGEVDALRLQAAESEPQNWFTGGGDKDGSYYSRLTTIDAKNVDQLGFAWQYDLGTPRRGQQATPIVIDGVMYTSGNLGLCVCHRCREPVASCGATIRNPTISRRDMRVAISSTAEWRFGKGRSMSARSTGACMP